MVNLLRGRNAYFLLAIFAFAFIAIAYKGISAPQPGDENIYYYMGRLVSEGKIPYKDFFYAHPPLQIYLIAALYKIFGFNIIVLKSLPLISALVSAFFIFKIAKEKFGELGALASSLLFLFSYSVMFNSVFFFGVEIAAAFLIIGMYFLLNKKQYYIGGLFFGLASISRLLALIPITVILLSVFFSGRKNFLKISTVFLSIFVSVNLLFIAISHGEYATSVYKFHLLKSSGGDENFQEYSDIIKLNWILFAASSLFIFAKDKKRLGLFVAVSIPFLIFLLSLKRLFGFYFLMAFPFLAIIGGYSLAQILKKLQTNKILLTAFISLLSVAFAWNLTADISFLKQTGFTGFERGNDMKEYIDSQPKELMLFGDSSSVPLLALLTNRKIALDFVDTNNQVFMSGIKDIGKVMDDLRGKNILFIIRSKEGISRFDEVKKFLNSNCEFLSQFSDRSEGAYMMYKCR